MKRQAIPICLDMLKELEKEIKKELKELKKNLGIKFHGVNRIAILFPIINYPTKLEGVDKEIYCADTWKFEGVKLKNENKHIQKSRRT